ncbi:MAG TPA: hypothetical protein VN754_12230 [Candidatus Binataceae bacterium]|nr:hypothetical protein [Candidatus Binataceae bacterium]
MNPVIAVINEDPAQVTAAEAKSLVAALSQQVTHLAAWYDVGGVTVVEFAPGKAPATAWWLVLLANADVAGALGYHDLTPAGLPIGKCFVNTSLQDGVSWQSCASHEFCEMLGDPWINLAADPGNGSLLNAYELCDAVEQDSYKASNGVELSNFVTPRWFITGAKGPYDHLGLCKTPGELRPGGYMSQYTGGAWNQVYGAKGARDFRRPERGSRVERRRLNAALWKR